MEAKWIPEIEYRFKKSTFTEDDHNNLLKCAEIILEGAQVHRKVSFRLIKEPLIYISNLATIGRDGDSDLIKDNNKRLSQEAFKLLKNASSLKEWRKQVTNEHPWPRKELWNYIIQNHKSKSSIWLLKLAMKYPAVTVSIREDILLNKRYRYKGYPAQRYLHANIQPNIFDYSPKEYFKSR